ncbi:MAG: hypothetical protein NT007_18405 [Candidatus Kapabacteria bacterium]|nr:hypothetical protein [Candidatus Kapabacteria bacterium]
MNIHALSTGTAAYTKNNIQSKVNDDSKQKEQKVSNNQKSVDKLELSVEARKLAPIKNRINSGFYNKTEVVKEVAKRVSQQLATK